jgi:hypothetical protein
MMRLMKPVAALLAGEMSAKLKADLTERFDELEWLVTQEVAAFVAEQTHNLEQQLQLSRGANAEKERALLELAKVAAAVAWHRKGVPLQNPSHGF